jgi:peptidyl-dipeptidase A
MLRLLVPLLFLLIAGCSSTKPAVAEAQKFLADAESKMMAADLEASRASWVANNFITEDTERLSAITTERSIRLAVDFTKQAARLQDPAMSAENRRKIDLLTRTHTLAAPADPKESEEVTRLTSGMEAHYGKAKYCKDKNPCLDVTAIGRIMAISRNEAELRDVWTGWHKTAIPRKDYERFVELSNKGARELGFADTGALWRSRYDMPTDDFAKEVDRLWSQVRPLYESLHTYTRKKLREKYGDAVTASGPIPAHLLGNIWAQDWGNVYPLLAPKAADPGFDLTAILKARKTTETGMVKYGEAFFSSLGFAPLPATFWDRSLFKKPLDREVVCHASAWDVDFENDLRIKMCIEPTAEDFSTIHHELGHNYYQRAYNKQPYLFRDSAHDGFHEAIGDTIALSITPEYLVKLGFIPKAPDPSKDTGLLLLRALEKVAILPWALIVDQWRWKVFAGEIKPDQYNQSWWDLRQKYQGVAPSVARPPDAFDPGAKYHVPANVPYARYFLAAVVQFQLHRSLAKAAGCTAPLHCCSIYQSKEAGTKLAQLLEAGRSKPWQETWKAVTGEDRMDATAIVEYFAPLKHWLDQQNQGVPSGW